jgi:drug/metabolite transporter (DMT)-like permease
VELSTGTIAVVLSAIFYAASQTSTKSLSNTDTPNAILLYMSLIFIPVSAIPAFYVWVTPDWSDTIPIILLGVFGYTAHACIIRAFAAADASFVMPFDFLRLPIAAAFGYFLYTEWPEFWVWVGGAIIFASTYYITWRESMVKKAAVKPTD